jgi:ATP-binding cassette subfamily B protein
MSEDLLEYIATISVIKAFSKEEQKTQNVLEGVRNYLTWIKKSMLSFSAPMSLISMLLEGGLIMTIIIGSLLLSDGQISAQKFILALILGGIFSASFAKLATLQTLWHFVQ